MRRRTQRKFGSLSARRRRFYFRRTVIALIFAAIVFTVLVWLINRPQFEIASVEVTGSTTYAKATLETEARTKLNGFYFGIVPRSFSFLYPKSDITKSLLQKFSALQSVSVRRDGLEALVIKVGERSPDALWCRNSNEREECFFMDSNGLVYGRAQDSVVREGDFIKYYGFLDNLSEPVGAEYLTKERFSGIKSFLGSLKAIGFAAKEFKRTSDGEYTVSLERGSKLLLKEDVDFNHVLSNVSSLLNDAELKSLFEQTPLPFEYIDLRLDSKVFYKRRSS